MLDKQHIENFLRANGVPASAKDEEIRSVLLSARWNENEVDTALMVLKENIQSKETHIDTLHKVFHTDDRLSPADISALLGIEVKLSEDNVNDIKQKRAKQDRFHARIAITLSIVIALCSVGYVMYREQAGLFHPSMTMHDDKV
jgi:hypothetical protein